MRPIGNLYGIGFWDGLTKKIGSKHLTITTSHHHIITASQIHNITTSHHHNFTSSQLHIIIASQHHNFTMSHHHNITSSQLHNITTSQLTSSQLTPSHHHNITTSQCHNIATALVKMQIRWFLRNCPRSLFLLYSGALSRTQ